MNDAHSVWPAGRDPHDFFTPLHQIINYSEHLADQAAAEGRDEVVRDLQRVTSAGRKLFSLIKDAFTVMPAELSPLPDDTAVVAAEAEAVPRSEGRLLVVDDNEVNLDILSRRLSDRGYTVSTAPGGREALDAVAAECFDVVLLDIVMPEVNGVEVLQSIRQKYSVADLPVIMVTSKDSSDDVVKALKLGANDYVTKPVDLNVTLARIGTQLRLKHANDMVLSLNRKLQAAQEKIASLLEASGEALQDVPGWAAEVADDLATMLHAAEIAVFVERDCVMEPLRPTAVVAPAIEETRAPNGDELVPVTGMSGELFGALVVDRKEGPWLEPERQLIATFARQLGGALELQHIRGELEEAKERGAATRQALIDRGLVLLALCPRCGRCFADPAATCDDGALLEGRLLPIEIDGRYRLSMKLGQGGMGEVFRAHDLRLDRDVAVKVIRAEHFGNSSARARFEREAKVLARIAHENVIVVHDSGELDDGSGFLVTELLNGWDLRNLLRLCGRGSPRQVAELVRQAGGALLAAHRAGVIHRDIKPANLFLTPRDPWFQVKLLDFGVAKASGLDCTFTQKGLLVGTPAYMAPEVFIGEPADVRSDIYSFAAAIYEALTGRSVVPRESRLMLRDVLYRQPPRVSTLVAGLPPEIDVLFRDALSKEPEQRPPVEELIDRTRVLETALPETAGWPPDLFVVEQSGEDRDGNDAATETATEAQTATIRIRKL
jgi:CheY-like chemotaxis protein